MNSTTPLPYEPKTGRFFTSLDEALSALANRVLYTEVLYNGKTISIPPQCTKLQVANLLIPTKDSA